MAVAIEFVNVIVRKSAVERTFPGGLDGFAREDLANLTEDDHLLRVGFMSSRDALAFVAELEAAGLRNGGLEVDSDIAVIAGEDGTIPAWLAVGAIDGYSACWASDYPAGEVVCPESGFLLRCPRAVYGALGDLLHQRGVEVHRSETEVEPNTLEKLRCVRGHAEITIDVYGDREGSTPIGLWGIRQLARRGQRRSDAALIRDIVSVLIQAGAKDK